MERTQFSPEVEAELISLSEQGDPYGIAIKKLAEEADHIRRTIERGKNSAQESELIPSLFDYSSNMRKIETVRRSIKPTRRFITYSKIFSGTTNHFSKSVESAPSEPSHSPRTGALVTSRPIPAPKPISTIRIGSITQIPPDLEKEIFQKKNFKGDALEEYRPYQMTQLICASIFLICASTIPAWVTLGIHMISPLIAIIGMIGAATAYAMSWSAECEVKRKNPTSE